MRRRQRPPLTTGAHAEVTNRNFAAKQSTRGQRQISGTAYGRGVVTGRLDAIALTKAGGGRHSTLWHAARCSGEYIAGGELFDEDQVAAMLISTGCSVGVARRDAERQVRRGIEKGKRNPKVAPRSEGMHNRNDAIARVVEWWAAVESGRWHGRRGASALKILAAFAMLAAGAGKCRLSESYRDIAEAAGVSVGTVSNTRALWQPYVRLVHRGHRFAGTRSEWQLVLRKTKWTNLNSPEDIPTGEPGLFKKVHFSGSPNADLWEQWPTGWRVYRMLPARDTTTVSEIAATTGLHPKTIRRALKVLAEHRLAHRLNRFEWRGYEQREMPEGLALERRKQRHKRERTLYKLQRDARAEQAAHRAGGAR
jgi:DNA-binding transcriptional ArsR family regulator